MKLKDVPIKKQIDITALPQTNILRLVKEEIREAMTTKEGKAKAGGLLITFEDREGIQIPQKYNAIAYPVFVEAMEKLGYEDTESLKEWHEYKLVAFRMGYPRYIPTKKIKQKPI